MAVDPEMKIGAFLAAHPLTEEPLLGLVPTLRKVRASGHWSTVAKLITLHQAAQLAGLRLPDLLAKLRAATADDDLIPAREELPADFVCAPDWLTTASAWASLDADALLKRGHHPVARVREALNFLAPGEVVAVSSTFAPLPLIGALRRRGFDVYTTQSAPGRHLTLVRKV